MPNLPTPVLTLRLTEPEIVPTMVGSDPYGGDTAYEPQYSSEFVALLPRSYYDAAVALFEIDSKACMKCATPVGYWLFEDDDRPQRSGPRWRDATLVVCDDGQYYYLCDDDMEEVPTP